MDNALLPTDILQEIRDHHEIRKLLSIYCHGADRGDEVRMRSVYGNESWDDHGDFKGPGPEFAKWVMGTLARVDMKCTHLLGQSLIKLDGDKAGAETTFLAAVCDKDERGEDAVSLLSGRFVDSLVRVNGQWKVDKRICVRDWSITLDVKKDSFGRVDFVQGQLSGQDPSYRILGLEHPGLPLSGAA